MVRNSKTGHGRTKPSRRIGTALMLLLTLSMAVMPPALGAQGKQEALEPAINLNTATLEQLQTLPGVGAETARRIIEHRNKIGKYNKIEEILNVKGMGEKKFQRIKNRLAV